MAWYQCSCGFRKEIIPRLGETITSACHLHRSIRLDGGATIVRMEEIGAPFAAEGAVPDEAAVCLTAA